MSVPPEVAEGWSPPPLATQTPAMKSQIRQCPAKQRRQPASSQRQWAGVRQAEVFLVWQPALMLFCPNACRRCVCRVVWAACVLWGAKHFFRACVCVRAAGGSARGRAA